MDPTSQPANSSPAAEIEQAGDKRPDSDAVDQQHDEGAATAASATTDTDR